MMKTNPELPASKCPACGHQPDAAEGISREKAIPQSGDFTVCFYCTAILRFEADLTVRRASSQEVRSLPRALRELLWRCQVEIMQARRELN